MTTAHEPFDPLDLDDKDATHGVPPVEYCPVSIGAKLVAERWTLLIVRELMVGATRFNEIHRGLPCISRGILTERLRHLERLGLVARVVSQEPVRRTDYRLTPSGHDLRPVLIALGEWTIAWKFPAPTSADVDPGLMLWRMCQGLDRTALPSSEFCIEFRFPDTDPSRGYIYIDRNRATACLGSPDHDVDVTITGRPHELAAIWYGHKSFPDAVRDGSIELSGQSSSTREASRWFRRSPFADQVSILDKRRSYSVT